MAESTGEFEVVVEEPMLVFPHESSKSKPPSIYLSPLDLQAPMFVYTLYFYRGDKISACERSSAFGILKEALEKVLVLYYPAAGRVKQNGESEQAAIECNDGGVLLVEAATDARIEELSDPMNADPRLEKFVYKLPTTPENPLLSIQVTSCACGGIIIGFGSRHELFDCFSTLQFLSAWGAIARGVPVSDIPLPSHERELLKPAPAAISESLSSAHELSSVIMSKFEGIPLITRTNGKESSDGGRPTVTDLIASQGARHEHKVIKVFRLTKEWLDQLKATAMENGELHRCSIFDVVTAQAWQARVRSLDMDPSEKIVLRFSMDCRRKIAPPLPPCFIGNVFLMAGHACRAGDILHSPHLSSIVKRVQQAKAEMTDSYIRKTISAVAATQRSMRALPSFRETTVVTDWTKYPLHLVDFGWGGTIFATQVAMPLRDVICLIGRGEEVFVRIGLLPNYMQRFEERFMSIS